jgi:hypothetical protein
VLHTDRVSAFFHIPGLIHHQHRTASPQMLDDGMTTNRPFYGVCPVAIGSCGGGLERRLRRTLDRATSAPTAVAFGRYLRITPGVSCALPEQSGKGLPDDRFDDRFRLVTVRRENL